MSRTIIRANTKGKLQMEKLTIKDIAQLAGVSKSTVSRVINDSGYVSKDTRDKVKTLINKSQYLPSANARSLSLKEYNTIGVVIPEGRSRFYSDVLSGVSSVLDEHRLGMLYCDTDNNEEKEERSLLMLRQQGIKGLIIAPARDYNRTDKSNQFKQLVNDLGVPVVLIDRPVERVPWDGIFYDHFNSAYLAVEHLIKQGYKRIAVITPQLKLEIGRQRLRGYIKALEDFDLKIDKSLIYKGDWSNETSYHLAKKLFEAKDRPDAIFNANNQTTNGFLKAAFENKIILGQDYGFVNFGYNELLDVIGLQYRYIERNAKEMGESAMRMLLERFENKDLPVMRSNTISAKLVE